MKKKPPRKAPKRVVASRPRPKPKAKPKAKPRAKPAARASEELTTLREELDEARAELARIASGENTARRDLESRSSSARSFEERLRLELEAMRVDLRTALADGEITRADQARAEHKLQLTLAELDGSRESERLATHASTNARERLHDIRAENETLRKHLFEANEQLRRLKEPTE